jgi:hypothetical protein
MLLVSCQRFTTVEGADHIRRAGSRLRTTLLVPVAVLGLLLALPLAGCGGESQSEGAPSGTWKATVLDWKFPKKQPLGIPQNFTIQVRNDDTRAIPQLVVNVSGLRTFVEQPGAASLVRQIWLTKDVDFGGISPYNSPLSQSFNLGKLDPGDVATYTVNLTPAMRGPHEVGYRLAPALVGNNQIVNAADGTAAAATRNVVIDPAPVFDRSVFKD